MKYFNSLLLVLVVVCFYTQSTVYAQFTGTLDYTPPSPKVGEQVDFTFVPPSPYIAIWDFGDGSKPENNGFDYTRSHTYTKSGTYTVTVSDSSGLYPPVSVEVTVAGVKSITLLQSRPRAGQKIKFTAVNFDLEKKCITWDFGDRSKREHDRTPPTIEHSYAKAGRYLVRAYDGCANTDPVTKRVTIGGDTRRASFSPPNPKTNQVVTFRLKGNYGNCSKLVISDGTTLTRRGSSPITHKFRKPGIYTVMIYGYCGDDPTPQTLKVPVVSGFSVKHVELRYKDASHPPRKDFEKLFKELVPNVEKNTRKFRAFTRIKYEGTGNIVMQWLVDRKVMQMITKRVFGADGRIEIGTGVDLPTHTLGMHTVSVRFLSPRGVDFRIPVIKYMVSPVKEKVQDDMDEENLAIILTSLTNEQGEPVSLDTQPHLTPGEYGIFDGVIENHGEADFKNGRLKVSLNGNQIDGQLLLNILAGGQKPFEVSMKMVEKEGMVEFVIVNQSGETIATQQLMVKPAVSP